MLQFPSQEDGIPKLIYQASNELLFNACGGHMVTYIGNDGGVKSAASDVFPRHKLAAYTPGFGKFMLHIVALGSEEAYGYNKNGDAFSKRALMEKHPTFVTGGHMFREHINRDPSQAIGEIKASAYHPGLQRVELILHGDCAKAEREYELVKAGKDLSGSMSCRVPFDVCSACQNQAKSAAVYCGHLRDHMLQYLPEFQKFAYAQNPDPDFFDYSIVENPAAVIARALQWHTGGLQKAASAATVQSGAYLAKAAGILPGNSTGQRTLPAERLQLLHKLAAWEERMEAWQRSGCPRNYQGEFAKVATSAFYPEKHVNLQGVSVRPGTLFLELAKRACLLSPDSLFSYVADRPELTKDAGYHTGMRTLFRDMLKQANCLGHLAHCCDAGSQLSSDTDPEYDHDIEDIMSQADELFGVKESLPQRAIHVTIIKLANTQDQKDATPTEEQRALLDMYGMYKLAAISDIQRLHPTVEPDILHMLAVGQNLQISQDRSII